MLIISLISAIIHILEVTVRGHLSPSSSWFFMPDGGMLEPAVMDNYSKRKPVRPHRDITFHLWTRSNLCDPQQLLVARPDILNASYYSANIPTKLIMHGFNQDGLSGDWIVAMKDAYLLSGDYNVISVNWRRLARSPLYHSAAMYSKDVGVHTARFVDMLVKEGSSLSNFHVIGFSLGAHAAGFMANFLTVGKLPRITGLDPALPAFAKAKPEDRLDKDDATFVDIIHTNGRAGRHAKGLGFLAPLGHADFYPNGGNLQPGCNRGTFGDEITGCSHRRAHRYFLESIINPNGFLSVPCPDYPAFKQGQCGDCSSNFENCILMGDQTPSNVSGTFYLKTEAESPYARVQITNVKAD